MSLEREIHELEEEWKAGKIPHRVYLGRLVRLRGICGESAPRKYGTCIMPKGHTDPHAGPWHVPNDMAWLTATSFGMIEDPETIRSRLRWGGGLKESRDKARVGDDLWPEVT